jgi:hypothetical protein
MELDENVAELLGFMAELPFHLWPAAIADYAGAHTATEVEATASAIELLVTSEENEALYDRLVAVGYYPALSEVAETSRWLTDVSQRLREKAGKMSAKGKKWHPTR